MFKNLFYVILAALIVVGIGYADQSTEKAVIRVDQPSATNGKQMYVSYCAPCHGVDGRGNGPAAEALKRHPTDLTTLSKTNCGKYPSTQVMSILLFGAAPAAHGSAQMPVWGQALGSDSANSTKENMGMLRIRNLSGYLQTLQSK